jgi:hypothetical protein
VLEAADLFLFLHVYILPNQARCSFHVSVTLHKVDSEGSRGHAHLLYMHRYNVSEICAKGTIMAVSSGTGAEASIHESWRVAPARPVLNLHRSFSATSREVIPITSGQWDSLTTKLSMRKPDRGSSSPRLPTLLSRRTNS